MKEFSFAYYKECLELAKNLEFKFLRYRDMDLIEDKTIYLRHDVDVSLVNALVFARIENELSIKSSYFIRIHAKGYNPFTLENYDILQKILEYGHEIGLHYEPEFARITKRNHGIAFWDDKTALEKLIKRTITGCSFHDPNRFSESYEAAMKELPTEYLAYEQFGYRQDIMYFSDSSGSFKPDVLKDIIQYGNKMIINTHPFWWFHETSLENF